MLTITLPKTEDAKERRIPVGAGKGKWADPDRDRQLGGRFGSLSLRHAGRG